LGGVVAVAAAPVGDLELARRIKADTELDDVLVRARRLVRKGLTAGSGYGEVWIRDLNTFIELGLMDPDPAPFREALLTFLKFQGPEGDIPDGYIPEARASVGYRYRKSEWAPGLLAHKNTVETDQETSLIQAVARYVERTRDARFRTEVVAGMTVEERLGRALDYLWEHRRDGERGLLWGATTVDWGDVQPEHPWGVELDGSSHRSIDIYDNAMWLLAMRDYMGLNRNAAVVPMRDRWRPRAQAVREAVRRHLWDAGRGKFIPHLYLEGSPFPDGLDEGAIWYHGGTAVAIEAGLLTEDEVRRTLAAMRENVRKAGASSIGLTVYPPYPDGAFKNPSMGAWSYQNGGDWCWFGGRMVRQLVRLGMVSEAYEELKPMVTRVIRHDGFHEWWTRDNQPRGSAQFRGSAGVLGMAIVELRAWADRRERAEPVVRRGVEIREIPSELLGVDRGGD
jgi:cellobiose phosphorylase